MWMFFVDEACKEEKATSSKATKCYELNSNQVVENEASVNDINLSHCHQEILLMALWETYYIDIW